MLLNGIISYEIYGCFSFYPAILKHFAGVTVKMVIWNDVLKMLGEVSCC